MMALDTLTAEMCEPHLGSSFNLEGSEGVIGAPLVKWTAAFGPVHVERILSHRPMEATLQIVLN